MHSKINKTPISRRAGICVLNLFSWPTSDGTISNRCSLSYFPNSSQYFNRSIWRKLCLMSWMHGLHRSSSGRTFKSTLRKIFLNMDILAIYITYPYHHLVAKINSASTVYLPMYCTWSWDNGTEVHRYVSCWKDQKKKMWSPACLRIEWYSRQCYVGCERIPEIFSGSQLSHLWYYCNWNFAQFTLGVLWEYHSGLGGSYTLGAFSECIVSVFRFNTVTK